ncbi:galactose-1-phosphate uridylyltransferase [Cellulosilyticum sp. I15G10I2]|uniref:galactose-1-phosphate uridylyltransferase n=1 Tax=Cellulosilyticum sp. I15G10I2 TaxID=1892843 RepID=UPI00085C4149|nr:DUF4931 domain-containing protein [Cellulosilyticum sp. I15G10I2]
MIYEDPYLLKSCIVAENRKNRPAVDELVHTCPFCPGHESDIEKVWLEVKQENNFLIKIVNNKYPICGYNHELYGVHDVVIDTPRHLQLPKDFSNSHWTILLDTMQKRWMQIAQDPKIEFIQIFKNSGKNAGASIRHSHWQIVALSQIPYQMAQQYSHYNRFYDQMQNCYICHKLEEIDKSDIILENDKWIAIAPTSSEFAHETWLVPKLHRKHYGELEPQELEKAGALLKTLLTAYEHLKENVSFNICFMSGGLHNALDYHFYIKIIPRLTHWAGFELATHCYINTIHPKTHVQLMRSILKE